jgi:hypothetical protein
MRTIEEIRYAHIYQAALEIYKEIPTNMTIIDFIEIENKVCPRP